jgi:hypothetical protein
MSTSHTNPVEAAGRSYGNQLDRGSCSTGFSLCGFLLPERKPKPHRLKPVLLAGSDSGAVNASYGSRPATASSVNATRCRPSSRFVGSYHSSVV